MVRITKRAVSRSLHPLIKRPTFSFDKTLLVTGSDSVQSLFPIHYSLDYSFYDIIYLPRGSTRCLRHLGQALGFERRERFSNTKPHEMHSAGSMTKRFIDPFKER